MDSRVKELFERYQSGRASKEEIKLVEDWFSNFDNQQHENLSEERKAVIFSKMDDEMHHLIRHKPRKLWYSNHWLQAAAVLLVCFSLVLFKIFKTPENLTQSISYTFITAPKGIKKQCFLPDGTLVYLNSGSAIRIASNFGVKDRQVLLSGEAFFIVKHNAAKPFNIHSGKLIIADIGTSFNVKAYPDEQQIQIAVESGKVSVEKSSFNKKSEILAGLITPNQQLTYDNQSEHHVLNYAQNNDISAWKQNRLCFDNASFNEIARTLERWYNITVKLNANVDEHRRYTVSFNNEPVTNVLRVLERLTGMSYEINDRTISINLKPSKKT